MKLRYLAALLTGLAALPAAAQFRPDRHFSLTAGQVARSIAKTLSDRGVEITEDQVSLPANIVATEPDPSFDVSTVSPLRDQRTGGNAEPRSAVRLTCHQPGTCIPFYAIVRWSGGNTQIAGRALDPVPAVAKSIAKANPEFVMRSGTHATLMLADNNMHIEVSVISLEDGIAGQKIRVEADGRREVYIAEVVSSNLLKGVL